MKRVAMISSPFERRDGILRHVIDLSNELARRGHRITIFGQAQQPASIAAIASEVEADVRVEGVPTAKKHTGKFSHYLFYTRELPSLIAQAHRAEPFDIVHAHGGYALALKKVQRATGAATVATAHGNEADRYRARLATALRGRGYPGAYRLAEAGALAPALTAVGRAAYAHADAVLASCRFVGATMARTYGVKPARIHLVPHAIHSRAFDSTSPPAADAPLKLLYVGRLFHDKGVGQLLQAFAGVHATHPEAELRIVGRGYLASDLHDLIRKLDLVGVVTFSEDFVAAADWATVYRDAPIFVMPSTYEPGISTALLEAMASARVCITSDFGGLGEVIREGEGFSYEAGNVTDLHAKLETAIAARAQWDKIGANARARIRDEYDWPQVARKVEDVYAQLA